MPHNWFYADAQNQQQGPVADAWLIGAYQRGEVRASTLVWREGLAAWTPLSAMARELGLQIAAGPPPLPAGRPARTVAAKPSGSSTWVIVVVVVLFGIVAIGGILAAIAIPAYQDFTQRAKVSQALMEATELKVLVADFFENQGRCLSNGEESIKAPEEYATPIIAAIKVGPNDAGECTVQVLFKNIGRGFEGKELLWAMDAKGIWRASSNLPDKYLPMALRNSAVR